MRAMRERAAATGPSPSDGIFGTAMLKDGIFGTETPSDGSFGIAMPGRSTRTFAAFGSFAGRGDAGLAPRARGVTRATTVDTLAPDGDRGTSAGK